MIRPQERKNRQHFAVGFFFAVGRNGRPFLPFGFVAGLLLRRGAVRALLVASGFFVASGGAAFLVAVALFAAVLLAGGFLAAIFLAGGPLAALRVAGLGLHADFGEALDETFGVVLRCVVDDGHLLAGNVDLDILHSLLEGNVVHDALGAVFAIDVGLEYRRYGRCLFRILRCGRAGAQPQCCHEADEQNLFHTRFVLVLTVNIKLGSTAGRYRTSFQTFLKPPFSSVSPAERIRLRSAEALQRKPSAATAKGGSEGLSARFYIGTVKHSHYKFHRRPI